MIIINISGPGDVILQLRVDTALAIDPCLVSSMNKGLCITTSSSSSSDPGALLWPHQETAVTDALAMSPHTHTYNLK